jgi:hypothetical protein
MHIEWSVLTDTTLTRGDLVVYAACSCAQKITVRTVARHTGLGDQPVYASLRKLVDKGHIRSETLRPRRFILRALSSDQRSDQRDLRSESSTTRYKGRMPDWELAENAAAKGDTSALALMGLFHRHWHTMYGLEYKSKQSFKADLAEVQILINRFGFDLVRAGVDALYSDHLKWLVPRRLDFMFDHDRALRHIFPVAKTMQLVNDSRPEWKPASAGVLHDPLQRG